MPTSPNTSACDIAASQHAVARAQELLACELAYAQIGTPDGAWLLHFTNEIVGYTTPWAPMVYMALLEKSSSGLLRWRTARSPVRLMRSIAWRAAWGWMPELHFNGDQNRALRVTMAKERMVNLSSLDRQDEDGYVFSTCDRAALGNGNHHIARRLNGIRYSHDDDPERAIYVDSVMARLGVRTQRDVPVPTLEPGGPQHGYDRYAGYVWANLERAPEQSARDWPLILDEALRLAISQTKKAALAWLTGEITRAEYGRLGSSAILRDFEKQYNSLTLSMSLHSAVTIGQAQDTLPYGCESFEELDTLRAAVGTLSLAPLCDVGFDHEEAELVSLKLTGITRESLKEFDGWEDVVDANGKRHSRAEAVWRSVDRKLQRPSVKAAFILLLRNGPPKAAPDDSLEATLRANCLKPREKEICPKPQKLDTVSVEGKQLAKPPNGGPSNSFKPTHPRTTTTSPAPAM